MEVTDPNQPNCKIVVVWQEGKTKIKKGVAANDKIYLSKHL